MYSPMCCWAVLPKGVTLPQGAKPQRMLVGPRQRLVRYRVPTSSSLPIRRPNWPKFARLLGEIDVPVRQVLIEARIVEADNTLLEVLGRTHWPGNDHKGLTSGHQVADNASLGNVGYQWTLISELPMVAQRTTSRLAG